MEKIDTSVASSSKSGGASYEFIPPSWTTAELHAAIPAHCFQRSTLRSLPYLVAQVAIVGGLFYSATQIDSVAVGDRTTTRILQCGAWWIYWTVQGMFMMGLWILGHECGHRAFSPHKLVNDVFGFLLHSFLLVPYHSFRISHAKHHAATGHLTRDEVFVPQSREDVGLPSRSAILPAQADNEDVPKTKSVVKIGGPRFGEMMDELLEDVPLYRLGWLIVRHLTGWPLYMFVNATGRKCYPQWTTNHFDPRSAIFRETQFWDIIISDFGFVGMLGCLRLVANQVGWSAVMAYYGVPYLMVNHWVVMLTYLQHTDPLVPHYNSSSWTFARGALSTIDRKCLGPVGKWVFHGVSENHVAHHVASKIPHYHLWEATEALKKFLGPHYFSSDENMFVSLWNCQRLCRFVDEDEDICFYKDVHGEAARCVSNRDAVSP
ncbi:hypothetical protein MNV49_000545 [Pseudohyphozyma bogoriensis]|nr:hypothetical protein MNV49_000545 [Pseudohyphozyma bogoriensis]